MHRVTGAMSAGEMYVHAVADNINSGFHDVGDGIEIGTGMMKEAVSHQMEVVTDATTSLGMNFQKSIQGYKREAGRFARSLSEFVDVEDVLKSISKVTNPDEYGDRKSRVIHTPIDWSKQPPTSRRKASNECSSIIEEEGEEEEEVEIEGTSRAKRNSTQQMKESSGQDHKSTSQALKASLLSIKTNKNTASHSPRMYRKQLMR